MFTLTVVWDDGKVEKYTYKTREEANEAGYNLKMAFGRQVWVGVS